MYSPASAKLDSTPYSFDERELTNVFFKAPFSIRVSNSGDTSPLELNCGQNPGEKSSKIENLGDRRTSSWRIRPKPLQPCLKDASLIPFQENIPRKSATAADSNQVRYSPVSTFTGFRSIKASFFLLRFT